MSHMYKLTCDWMWSFQCLFRINLHGMCAQQALTLQRCSYRSQQHPSMRAAHAVTHFCGCQSRAVNALNMDADPNSSVARTLSFLNLIDLAGSESAKAAVNKGHRTEGSYINKSLLTLGTVIAKLSDGNAAHIPFRDSKLTRLLQVQSVVLPCAFDVTFSVSV